MTNKGCEPDMKRETRFGLALLARCACAAVRRATSASHQRWI
jgi:hypothetical protein